MACLVASVIDKGIDRGGAVSWSRLILNELSLVVLRMTGSEGSSFSSQVLKQQTTGVIR